MNKKNSQEMVIADIELDARVNHWQQLIDEKHRAANRSSIWIASSSIASAVTGIMGGLNAVNGVTGPSISTGEIWTGVGLGFASGASGLTALVNMLRMSYRTDTITETSRKVLDALRSVNRKPSAALSIEDTSLYRIIEPPVTSGPVERVLVVDDAYVARGIRHELALSYKTGEIKGALQVVSPEELIPKHWTTENKYNPTPEILKWVEAAARDKVTRIVVGNNVGAGVKIVNSIPANLLSLVTVVKHDDTQGIDFPEGKYRALGVGNFANRGPETYESIKAQIKTSQMEGK